jgi:hypothetical protein
MSGWDGMLLFEYKRVLSHIRSTGEQVTRYVGRSNGFIYSAEYVFVQFHTNKDMILN